MSMRSAVVVLMASAALAATCEESNKDKDTCLSNSEDGENCAFCSSGAVGNTCLKESDAKGLPSSVFKCEYSETYLNLAASPTCEESNKDAATCLAVSEDGEQCAFCTSGAVGNSCLKESDAKGLPASVFQCEYADTYLALAASATCEESNKDEATCLAVTEDGEQCAFCTSGAVGNSCMKESDAQGLPSSVFKCTYATLAAASTCEPNNADKETCLATTEGDENCAFCTSGAVGNTCMVESDAQGLPSSVFKCEYSSSAKSKHWTAFINQFWKF